MGTKINQKLPNYPHIMQKNPKNEGPIQNKHYLSINSKNGILLQNNRKNRNMHVNRSVVADSRKDLEHLILPQVKNNQNETFLNETKYKFESPDMLLN